MKIRNKAYKPAAKRRNSTETYRKYHTHYKSINRSWRRFLRYKIELKKLVKKLKFESVNCPDCKCPDNDSPSVGFPSLINDLLCIKHSNRLILFVDNASRYRRI